MRLIALLLFSALASGCATKQYFHTAITDPAEVARQKAIDEALCTQASAGLIQVPQIAYQPSNGNTYRSTGTVTTESGIATYSGVTRQTPTNSFSQGFANGANIGSAVAARRSQDKIFHGCMVSKGWSDEPAMAGTKVAKRTEKEIAEAEWRATIEQFLKMEAARPDGIDYARDELKMLQLDTTVKQLANDPRNESKSMQWFLIEADRIVKEHYSPERMFLPRKN